MRELDITSLIALCLNTMQHNVNSDQMPITLTYELGFSSASVNKFEGHASFPSKQPTDLWSSVLGTSDVHCGSIMVELGRLDELIEINLMVAVPINIVLFPPCISYESSLIDVNIFHLKIMKKMD